MYSKFHIMVIDDMPANLQIIGTILRENGFLISIAKNGEHGIKMIEENLPDLVLLDVVMPEMDGFEVCRRLKSNSATKKIPVIFLSALYDTVDKVQGLKIGAVDYVTKPINREELLARIDTHLKIKKLQEELEELNETLVEKVLERTKELLESKEEAERANRAKSQFLSNMSHELRTPMNGIMGTAQILLMMEKDKEKIGFLKNIEASSELLTNMINDMLEMSEIEADKIEMENEGFKLLELINRVYSIFRISAQKKELELCLEIDENVPEEIIGDKGKINQILANIMGNAIKFTECGSVKLTIKRTDKYLEFSVNDTGIGIEEDKIEEIMEPFVQGDLSYTKKYQGTGLGLAISKKLVRLIGGEIYIESEAGKGTKVSFTVPL